MAKEMILEGAFNGPNWLNTDYANGISASYVVPNIPTTIEDLVADVKAFSVTLSQFLGVENPAFIAHVHIRSPISGRQTKDADLTKQLLEALRKEVPDAILSVDASMRGDALDEFKQGGDYTAIRMRGLSGRPDILVTTATEELPFGLDSFQGITTVSGVSRSELTYFHQQTGLILSQTGAIAAAELTTYPGSLQALRNMAEYGLLPKRMEFFILPGFSAKLPLEGAHPQSGGDARVIFDQVVAEILELQKKYGISGPILVGSMVTPTNAKQGLRPEIGIDWALDHPSIQGLRVGLEDCPLAQGGAPHTNAEYLRAVLDYTQGRVQWITDKRVLQEMLGVDPLGKTISAEDTATTRVKEGLSH